MKKLLLVSSICLLTTLVHAQGQALPAAPSSTDYAEIIKKMQLFQEQLNVVQTQLKALEALKAGTKAPLDQPLLKSDQVIEWVKGSIIEIYSYNFANYKQVISNIARYFTPPGYESYVKALQDAGNLKIMEDKKTIVTAMIAGDVKITKEGIENNTYSWMVQVPLKVTYQDPVGLVVQDILANIQVVRINDEKHPEGIAIHSIAAEAKPEVISPTVTTPAIPEKHNNKLDLPVPVMK